MFGNFDIIEEHLAEKLRLYEEENDLLKLWIKGSEEIYTCCVCNRPIKGLSLQRMLRPFRWDTRACFEWKPRKMVFLEREYGLDILDVLKETSRRYGSLRSQVHALNISVPYFTNVIEKYSGMNYLDFMAKFTVGERRRSYLKKLESEKYRNKIVKRKPIRKPASLSDPVLSGS